MHCQKKNKCFLPYFKYLLGTDFVELEDMIKQRLEIKSLNKLTDDDIVAGAIADTIQDAKKKRKNKNYYMCNSVCLLKTISHHLLYNVI